MANNGISRETLVALHETDGIGWQTIQKLWEARRERPVYPGMREGDLRDCGLSLKQAAAVAASLREECVEAGRARRERDGIGVLTIADKSYPSRLRRTEGSPQVLYYRGDLSLLSRPAIAIVGTRLATAYGRHVAESFAAAFADRGFTVVSGLARGIDTCAHRGALDRAGGTIAVLGLPVEQIYPPENRQLYRAIEAKGLLLSEAPPGTPYHSGMFPSRNRIIAGLSLAVVIAEAPENSGALITAECAFKANRTVYVVPGPVTSPRSRGAMKLLSEGSATIALAAEDVIATFARHVEPSPDILLQRNSLSSANDELTEEERTVYELLLDEPRSIDELSADCGIEANRLPSLLLSMQLKRRIHRLPGSLYGAL